MDRKSASFFSDNEISTVKPYQVLVPLAGLREARVLLPLAEAIVKARQGQLIVLHVMTVPDGQPLSEAASNASHFREALTAQMIEMFSDAAQARTMVRVASEVWEGIWDLVRQEQIDLLVLGWPTEKFNETVVSGLAHPQLTAPPCDVIAVRPDGEIAESDSWEAVRGILLPIRGGPYAGFALRIANALAQATDSRITILHATDKGSRIAEEQLLSNIASTLRGLDRLKRTLTVVDNVSDAILEESTRHQVLVMGAPADPVYGANWGGPIIDPLIQKTSLTLIAVKGRSIPLSPEVLTSHQDAVQAPQLAEAVSEPRVERLHPAGDRPVAVVVDQWFAENTFHSREFANLEQLVALKESQNLTISLGLPALNEAATVGNVIQTVKTVLMDECPLLDEIVLIDSGSVDYTREIAADLGIPVYVHQEILPQYGSYHGKGEALWKSLFILKGDIVAWIDTDIKNIHPRFVYGILGPLLRDPSISYVKGFYRRPLREGDKLVAGGGGRVTELTARPFINLLFPELSGVIQPLSGEYAGRRHALERTPFFTGYGVETGLLIDLLDEFGLNAIAQVDLLERIHHNQPLPSLSKMSFAIMQVVFSRLEKIHNVDLLKEANLTMNLIRYGPARYYLETEEIREVERPPIATLPEYQELHGRAAGLKFEMER